MSPIDQGPQIKGSTTVRILHRQEGRFLVYFYVQMACELMTKEYSNIRKFVFIGHWLDSVIFVGPQLSMSNWQCGLKTQD